MEARTNNNQNPKKTVMKKIFTLITLTLISLSAMADTVVTITDETSDGTVCYAMFSATEALDFSAVDGVEAFAAKSVFTDRELPNGRIVQELSAIALLPVSQVPAGTGLVVKSSVAGTFNIPTATAATAPEENELVAVSERTDAAWAAVDEDEEIYNVPFVLGTKNGKFGFIPVADYNDFDEETGWMVEDKFFLEPGTSYIALDYSLASPSTVVAVVQEQATETVSVTTLDALTDGTSFYNLVSFDKALDFSAADGIEAFAAKSVYGDRELPNGRIIQELKSIELVPVSQVPAGAGVVVKSSVAGTYEVPTVGTAAALVENELVAVLQKTDIFDIADMDEETVPFVLGVKNGSFGFVPVVDYNGMDEETGWVPEGQVFLEPGTAYISLDYSLATPSTVISVSDGDDVTTAIHHHATSINTQLSVFDLQGRRVAQPQKGLYVVGGKKVIVK